MISLNDIQTVFAALPAKLQDYSLENVPSVPEQYIYYTNHWFFRDDSEELNRQRAINDVYFWHVALRDGTYGYQD